MGNSNSRSRPRQSQEDIWEMRRVFELIREIGAYLTDNARLVGVKSNLTLDEANTKNVNNNEITRLENEEIRLKANIDNTTKKFIELKNKNADPTDLRMTEIADINDKLQKDTLNYMLIDVNTKKNIYNLIKSQNNLIDKNSLDLLKNTDKNYQKYTYSLEQYNEIENINTIFFVLYYFLFIIFLFFIIFKINYPIILKIIIGLIFLIYPFVIYTIETIIYNIIYSLYLDTFSIFTIEKMN